MAMRELRGGRVSAGNHTDKKGKPAGGMALGKGIEISWQCGPLGTGEERQEPNGAFLRDVLEVGADRLRYYQTTEFSCRENAIALTHLETAILWLDRRQEDREARGVEGTHEK